MLLYGFQWLQIGVDARAAVIECPLAEMRKVPLGRGNRHWRHYEYAQDLALKIVPPSHLLVLDASASEAIKISVIDDFVRSTCGP